MSVARYTDELTRRTTSGYLVKEAADLELVRLARDTGLLDDKAAP